MESGNDTIFERFLHALHASGIIQNLTNQLRKAERRLDELESRMTAREAAATSSGEYRDEWNTIVANAKKVPGLLGRIEVLERQVVDLYHDQAVARVKTLLQNLKIKRILPRIETPDGRSVYCYDDLVDQVAAAIATNKPILPIARECIERFEAIGGVEYYAKPEPTPAPPPEPEPAPPAPETPPAEGPPAEAPKRVPSWVANPRPYRSLTKSEKTKVGDFARGHAKQDPELSNGNANALVGKFQKWANQDNLVITPEVITNWIDNNPKED